MSPLLVFALLGAAPHVRAESPAANANVTGPVLGYVHDARTGAVRSILGVPGAAMWDAPSSRTWQLAEAAPAKDYLIAVADGTPFLLRPALGETAAWPVDGEAAGVDRIAWSPSGGSAALLSSAAGRIAVAGGFPGRATIRWSIDGAGDVVAFAVSDAGDRLLAATKDGRTFQWTTSGERSEIPVVHVNAIAFRPNGEDALLVSAADRSAWLITGSGANASYIAVDGQGAMDSAVSAVFDAEGRSFYVASANGVVARFNAGGELLDKGDCNCTPTRLARAQGSAFLVNPGSEELLTVLDGSGPGLRFLFVPAPVEGDRQ